MSTNTLTRTTTRTALVAVLDADAPVERLTLTAPRQGDPRPADMVDPVTGDHTWFRDGLGIVVVQERDLPRFNAYVRTRGMVAGLHDFAYVEHLDTSGFDTTTGAIIALTR